VSQANPFADGLLLLSQHFLDLAFLSSAGSITLAAARAPHGSANGRAMPPTAVGGACGRRVPRSPAEGSIAQLSLNPIELGTRTAFSKSALAEFLVQNGPEPGR